MQYNSMRKGTCGYILGPAKNQISYSVLFIFAKRSIDNQRLKVSSSGQQRF